jgi:hypothetical protein
VAWTPAPCPHPAVPVRRHVRPYAGARLAHENLGHVLVGGKGGTARAVAPCARRLGRARSREGGRVVEVESTLKRRRNGRDGAIFTPPGSCAATASDADRRTYERVRQPAAAGPPWGERGEIASESPDHRRRADREKDPAI